jgi:hypothetical protein
VPAHAIPQYVTNQTHSQNAGALGHQVGEGDARRCQRPEQTRGTIAAALPGVAVLVLRLPLPGVPTSGTDEG